MSYRNERQRDRLDDRSRRKEDARRADTVPGVTTHLVELAEVLDEAAAAHLVEDMTGDSPIGFGVIGRMLT